MKKVLVIGASGFVGSHLTKALLTTEYTVRCLTRDPSRMPHMASDQCEIVRGDVADPASLKLALHGMDAVYISMHTIAPQQAGTEKQNFVEIEKRGLHNVVEACLENGVHRLIHITSLGSSPNESSEWVRGRWESEQSLLKSGLNVTILRPGQIVGAAGMGFKTMLSQAKGSLAILIGNGQQKTRSIAINDLVYYLVGILNDPRSFGQIYDVGGDDVWTADQMIDLIADVLKKKHPMKIHLSTSVLAGAAPLVERFMHMQKGSFNGFLSSLKTDMVGNPLPIRALLPQHPLSYREAVEQVLRSTQNHS
ncbi:SDR family oxidoreductase [Spirosoma validum]|uniref:NAD(P)H-binding protein n=1 Tax=Spirosoma validum TaxID=2771355 RepID=A0A927B6M8_9BACT|nr:NAD(P)H-binding protein [Spirosoma validum]MBD2756665.1 NAD(P)H-binding protein [Spirosoma validum]